MKLQYIWILVIILSVNTFNAKADPNIAIVWATESWPEYTNKDGTGLYHELFNLIFAQSPYQITVKYVPWKRAINEVEINNAHITGALPKNGYYLFADTPILYEPISILAYKHTDISSLARVKELIGTWPIAYSKELMQPKLAPYIDGVTSANRPDAIKLLVNNKVDYYLDARSMLEAQLATLSIEQQSHFKIQDYARLNLYMIFSKDDKGQALKAYYDAKTKQLFATKALDAIYQKYQLMPPRFSSQ